MKNNLRTISAHLPFADTLADWVLENWGHNPLTLSRALILVPSRRAAQSLREAFLRVSGGKPVLLPRIEPLGDADEDTLLLSPLASLIPGLPSPLFAFRRLFLLARLVQHQRRQTEGGVRTDHALALAAGLAQLMDECGREEVSLDALAQIVPDTFAAHWQETVTFLQILSAHWPEIARTQGLISPGDYRSQLLRALALHWQQSPPETPIIVAGSTGSIPSTADLLAVIAGLPQGFIVLPGLDAHAEPSYYEALEESHPQWGMAQLLGKLKVSRGEVQPIGLPENARTQLLSEIMRPALTSERWRSIAVDRATAVRGMEIVDAANLQEEATAIALMLRETLEHPAKTAALVTHNRGLARRVAAIMHRFGVTIDDSAGLPLSQTPLVVFMRLIADAAVQAFAALPLMGLLKHPLAQLGMERIACLEAARALELLALRGLAISGGIDGMRRTLLFHGDATPPEVFMLLDRLEQAFAPLQSALAQRDATLGRCLNAHIACAEALGGEELWSGPEGETFSQLLWEVRQACASDDLPMEPASYPGIFDELLKDKVLRPEYGTHPRLKILSPMEARMQSFDRVILGGLNEGSWPPAPQSDPWFSRPMRAVLGLPQPERRLGLAAHDFYMLASAPEVILTRAAKEDGVPLSPSRWLIKLKMLAAEALPPGTYWLAWARALDTPIAVHPLSPPAPRPPLHARPREISVTQVETWMRNPYALYASRILRLRALDALGRTPEGSDFGNGVHRALERFVRLYPRELPTDALARLLEQGRAVFSELFAATSMEILWWPRFTRIAEWVIAESERRGSIKAVAAEVEGTLRFGDFLLRGRADRVEEYADGSLAIIDYKTGSVPLNKDIEGGLASQLILLALIAREGELRFRGDPIALEYWQLSGAEEAGEIKPIDAKKIPALIDAAKEGLAALIARYNDEAFPYRATPIAARGLRYDDYEHLARAKEWS